MQLLCIVGVCECVCVMSVRLKLCLSVLTPL